MSEGIVHVLAGSGFEVLGTAADARELVQMAALHRPDVVIADIQMPPDHGDDGLRAALAIRDANPGVGVLVLSRFLEDRYAFDLVADGAQGVGYLLKEKSAICASSPTPCAGWPTASRRSIRTWWRAWWAASARRVRWTG